MVLIYRQDWHPVLMQLPGQDGVGGMCAKAAKENGLPQRSPSLGAEPYCNQELLLQSREEPSLMGMGEGLSSEPAATLLGSCSHSYWI